MYIYIYLFIYLFIYLLILCGQLIGSVTRMARTAPLEPANDVGALARGRFFEQYSNRTLTSSPCWKAPTLLGFVAFSQVTMWSLVYLISFANRINARENKDFDLLKWIVNC